MTIISPITNPESCWLKPEQLERILDIAWEHSERNFLIIMVLLRTGRRLSELLRLKPSDISWKERMILFHIDKKYNYEKDADGNIVTFVDEHGKERYKTKKVDLKRWKAVDDETLEALREYINQHRILPDRYVFFSPYDQKKHISRKTVWHFMNKYAKLSGIPLHPHQLRHSFAVMIAKTMESPSDLRKLSSMLEHSSTQITETYLQFNTKETRDLLQKAFSDKKKSY